VSTPFGQLEITRLLVQWRNGDKQAESKLMEVLYPILRAKAQLELRCAAHLISLSATELAHEAYLRLIDQRGTAENRTHFLAIVSRVMRRVLVDLLRVRNAEKRGGDIERVTLQLTGEVGEVSAADTIDWFALEQALTALEKRDPIAANIVEMRYFGGMTIQEVAGQLRIAESSVSRHWEFARAWLHRRI
jgi:RNA polymerase sigma factor (TIGR02999 family)